MSNCDKTPLFYIAASQVCDTVDSGRYTKTDTCVRYKPKVSNASDSRGSRATSASSSSTKELRSPHNLVILCKTIVLPLVEYCCLVWSPRQAFHIEMLNRVQVRFIRALGLRLGYQYIETPRHTVEELFDIQPLFLRWAYQDLNFL
ncbi:hypothetical protein J6590_056281 [Homalodisca vitripennis]|nr:hypothetical protein J6590_056281 [Homalodisca vitripennis]